MAVAVRRFGFGVLLLIAGIVVIVIGVVASMNSGMGNNSAPLIFGIFLILFAIKTLFRKWVVRVAASRQKPSSARDEHDEREEY